MKNQLIIIMGISGSGKSTLAANVAEKLQYEYVEGDDFHSHSAKLIMASGQSISNSTRQLWVDRIQDYVTQQLNKGKSIVLAFSGIKYQHRKQLASIWKNSKIFLLHGDAQIIAARMAKRNHFVSEAFLASQLKEWQALHANEKQIQLLDLTLAIDKLTSQVCAASNQVEPQLCN